MSLDTPFLDCFSSYFNPDLLEPDNKQQLLEDIRACAANVSARPVDLIALSEEISRFLREWDMETMMQFIDTTTTDWLCDKKAEQLLRYILTEMVEELRLHIQRRSGLEGPGSPT